MTPRLPANASSPPSVTLSSGGSRRSSRATAQGECWRLPAARVNVACKKLSLGPINEAYCRDIVVWLPDIQFKQMPPCGECRSASAVAPHCFRSNTSDLRICALDTDNFVISRRYICSDCKRAADVRKASAQVALAAAQAVAMASGLRAEEEAAENAAVGGKGGRARRSSADDEEMDDSKPYTFMGYNHRSLMLLPYGLGASFPAYLTHHSGLDKQVIDLMVSLFDKGIRPESLSSTLLELHSKRYWRLFLWHEQAVRKHLDQPPVGARPPVMFSTFGDKGRYAGAVPSGNYLASISKAYSESIAPYLDKEVKKRGAELLAWDASYKEAKRLAKHHGQQVYLALITGTNELGEVRVQFHVVTDGHDQMEAAIKAFLATMRAYGQTPPRLFFTDKPLEDKSFFQQTIPLLQVEQVRLDSLVPGAENALEPCKLTPSQWKLCSTARDININVNSLRTLVKGHSSGRDMLALDCEWSVNTGSGGSITSAGRVAVIQLGYTMSSGEVADSS